MKNKKANELYSITKLALFATSYSPLFILIIIKQVYDNWGFFYFGGLTEEAIKCFCSNFFVSAILFIFLLFGIIGCFLFLSRQKKKTGDSVVITEVNNKNSESIGYIATYIIPFIFQSFNSIYEVISILFIFVIIYYIYINSNMLLVNPFLNMFKYSIFEITCKCNEKTISGLVIIHDSIIEEESTIQISQIGFKLYYAKNIE
jgi:hypothetical protein